MPGPSMGHLNIFDKKIGLNSQVKNEVLAKNRIFWGIYFYKIMKLGSKIFFLHFYAAVKPNITLMEKFFSLN